MDWVAVGAVLGLLGLGAATGAALVYLWLAPQLREAQRAARIEREKGEQAEEAVQLERRLDSGRDLAPTDELDRLLPGRDTEPRPGATTANPGS